MSKKYTYRTNHLPTGRITETDINCGSKQEFLYLLNKWNTDGKGAFIYTATKVGDLGAYYHPIASHDFSSTRVVKESERTPEQVKAEGGYWTSTEAEDEGTEGQDRESYSDDQDRENYTVNN